MILHAGKTPSELPVAQTQPLQSGPPPQTYMSVVHENYEDDSPPPAYKRRSLRRRRLLRGILTLIILILICKTFVSVKIRWPAWLRGDEDDGSNADTKFYEILPEIVLDRCLQGDDWVTNDDNGLAFYRTANITFEIPLSADNIFLISRGHLSRGFVEVKTSSDQPKDTVTFKVVANYHQQAVRDLAKACFVSRHKTERGVGLFTPTWPSGGPQKREDTMSFSTTIIFPDFSEGVRPFSVKGFATDVPNMYQHIEHLKSKVHFDSFSLKGTNSGIHVESLVANKATIATSNAPIRGILNTTSFISLYTSNAPIQVEVGLVSDSTEPMFVAETSNGAIDSKLRLSTISGHGGKFDVSTLTHNSPLSLDFLEAPLDSILKLDARTSNSPASVSLHPTYQGTFDIQTSSRNKAEIKFIPADDPSGKQRKRGTLVLGHSKSHISGNTIWADQNGRKDIPPGAVSVQTSNVDVTLDILGN